MCKRSIVVCLTLIMAAVSYGDTVICNWENSSLDGAYLWDPANSQLLPGQPYEATSGSESLGVIITPWGQPNTCYWNLGVKLGPRLAAGTIDVSMDVTFDPCQWGVNTNNSQWAMVDSIYWRDAPLSWNQNLNLTVKNRDTGLTVPKAWKSGDNADANDGNMTYTWTGLSVPAGSSFGEIGFGMQDANWTMTGIFYLDNLRITYEPAIIFGWGDNEYGQAKTPQIANNYAAIAAGCYHSLALRSNGSIYAWGDNSMHQLSRAPPLTDTGFIAIAAGYSHSVALRSNGSIRSWGSNVLGQLNNAPEGSNFIAIAAGAMHSLALTSDGSIVAWGDNSMGQLDNIPAGNDFIAIAAGGYHSVALRSNGAIAAWGDNSVGQLDNIPAGNDFIAIAAGGFHSLALKSDNRATPGGSIVAWGANTFGQATPPDGNDFIAIAAGCYHSLALKSNGSIVGWGNNYDDFGNWLGQATPPAGKNFIAIAAGWSYSVALRHYSFDSFKVDLNNDGRVDIADFAEFASKWLVNCYTDPTNPACAPK